MQGFVDLHCHWVAAIDDGARTPDDGLAMLRGLREVGFDTVVATPHMRPSMFDNDRPALERAFAGMQQSMQQSLSGATPALPAVHLASEHFFDDIVYGRLLRGEGLPYPGGRRVLIEFGRGAFPLRAQHRLFDLRRAGLGAVLAHPERYEPVWRDDACLDPLLDAGAVLLLDLAALVGKYGRAPQDAAEKLLEADAYEAACSDAHRPADVDDVARGIERLRELAGDPGARRLLVDGPRGICAFGERRDTGPGTGGAS
ncbi:MAG: protein tyrosine phosphatase [Myxococcales bacterium]|nr:protein tyrosine phosphatase [Myxococcales bacterium]